MLLNGCTYFYEYHNILWKCCGSFYEYLGFCFENYERIFMDFTRFWKYCWGNFIHFLMNNVKTCNIMKYREHVNVYFINVKMFRTIIVEIIIMIFVRLTKMFIKVILIKFVIFIEVLSIRRTWNKLLYQVEISFVPR